MTPTLSIIIPHYNVPMYLSNLLGSIPNTNEIQVIVIDDHSTDLVDEYRTLKSDYPHVTFLQNDPENKGAGTARNLGLKYAIGQWLLFADSDDMFIDGFYNTVSTWFNKDVDVVFFTPISRYDDSGENHEGIALYRNYISNYNQSKTSNAEQILRYMWNVTWSLLIRKKIVDDKSLTFSNTLRHNEIVFITKTIFFAKKIEASDKSIYIQTIRKSIINDVFIKPAYTETVYLDNAYERIKKYLFLKKHLPKNEFLALPLHGINIILSALMLGCTLNTSFKIFKMCRDNGVVLFHKSFFNPKYFLHMLFRWVKVKKHLNRQGFIDNKMKDDK